ncbi:MAG TPA: hypothetical protein VMI13_10810 [Solirubrobacteraceae bacterium]|nr:hypothetical protein [Solirubrobacteraceae bacterium]
MQPALAIAPQRVLVGALAASLTLVRARWDAPSSIMHNGFTPDPALIQFDPREKRFTF